MSEIRVFAVKAAIALSLVLIVLLALYVWPGFWRYEYRADGIMIDKLTQRVYHWDSWSARYELVQTR